MEPTICQKWFTLNNFLFVKKLQILSNFGSFNFFKFHQLVVQFFLFFEQLQIPDFECKQATATWKNLECQIYC